MKVLYITPILEHPAAGGPQLRIENSIIALNKVAELHILSGVDRRMIGGERAEKFFKSHSQKFIFLPSVIGLSYNRYIRIFQMMIVKPFSKIYFQKNVNFIIDYAKRRKINILWFGYGNISFPLIEAINKKAPSLKLVCDTDSVWSRFILRELPFESDPERKKKIKLEGLSKKKEEKEWVNLCNVTTAVSAVDAEYYRRLTSNKKKIHIFSNVINLETYKKLPKASSVFKKPSIFLGGTFGKLHSPMDTAARWVIEDVLPAVRKEIPDVHFYIVGRNSDKYFGNLNDLGITVTGKVDSILPYLSRSDVAIVPLKFESGTRFKILEAAACKIPVVSTSVGAEGLPVTNGVDILIADKSHDFARAILRLLKDKKFAKRIAQNCYHNVTTNFITPRLVQEAKDIINYLN